MNGVLTLFLAQLVLIDIQFNCCGLRIPTWLRGLGLDSFWVMGTRLCLSISSGQVKFDFRQYLQRASKGRWQTMAL